MPSSNSSSLSITHVVSDLPRLPTKPGGYVYITCNDAGVEFVHATATNPEFVTDLFAFDRTVEILGKQSNEPYQKNGRVTAIIENGLKSAVSKPPKITSARDDGVSKTKRTTQPPCSKTISMSTLLCMVSLVALMIPPLAEARSPGPFPGGSWQGGHSTFNGGTKVAAPMGWTRRNENLNSQGYGGDTAELFNTFRNIVSSIWQLGQNRDGENNHSGHSPVPKIPKHVPHRKLYWRSGPGFGIQRLPSELQAPESEAPSPNPSP